MRKLLLILTAAGSLTIAACLAQDANPNRGSKPAEHQLLQEVDDFLSSRATGYHFKDATASEGVYQGQSVWVVDYKFTATNAFGMPIPGHMLVYMQNEKVLASEKPVSYFQEEQDNQAKLLGCLSAKFEH
jgi:hypothetical protein